MSGDLARCVEMAVEASKIEREAMHLDRSGMHAQAVKRYRDAADKLLEAASACPDSHPDRGIMEEHAREVQERASYLDEPHSETLVPLEEHIHGVQLSIGVPAPVHAPRRGTAPPRTRQVLVEETPDRKVMGAAAAISGAAGLFLLGPVSAAALSVAAAYATTREDTAGTAARKVGKVGIKVVEKARHLDEEYRIINRATTVGQSALDQALALDSKYGILHRAKSATTTTQKALTTFNERHQVIHKLSRGISTASSALSSLVLKATR